ncbi:MAG: L-histidine N(alpha)-methyltransferase [Pseudomonadota bacterium]
MDGGLYLPPVVDPATAPFLADALAGLTAERKHLSPKWLYDRRGSELFEQITTLPEYYVTRTEAAILRENAARLAKLVPPGGALVELGSGASVKTRTLLSAGGHFGAYVPIDISADFLEATADGLRLRYPGLSVRPVVADFTEPVRLPGPISRMRKVAFFPGSTIGNLPPEMAVDLLAGVRAWPKMEALVLGVDLVKDPADLVAAYDDAQGVTAAFILNILKRLNDEVHADFDLEAFDYRARWCPEAAQVEMGLISRIDQVAQVGGRPVFFGRGEDIHVSTSRKYTADSLAALARAGSWRVDETMTDAAERFAVAVLRPD